MGKKSVINYERMAKLLDDGFKPMAIADRLGCEVSCIYRFRREMSVGGYTARKRRPRIAAPEETENRVGGCKSMDYLSCKYCDEVRRLMSRSHTITEVRR